MADIQNYAVIDLTNGNVVNVVAWDGVSEYTPGAGLVLIQSDVAGIGWAYDGTNFTNPNAGE